MSTTKVVCAFLVLFLMAGSSFAAQAQSCRAQCDQECPAPTPCVSVAAVPLDKPGKRPARVLVTWERLSTPVIGKSIGWQASEQQALREAETVSSNRASDKCGGWGKSRKTNTAVYQDPCRTKKFGGETLYSCTYSAVYECKKSAPNPAHADWVKRKQEWKIFEKEQAKVDLENRNCESANRAAAMCSERCLRRCASERKRPTASDAAKSSQGAQTKPDQIPRGGGAPSGTDRRTTSSASKSAGQKSAVEPTPMRDPKADKAMMDVANNVDSDAGAIGYALGMLVFFGGAGVGAAASAALPLLVQYEDQLLMLVGVGSALMLTALSSSLAYSAALVSLHAIGVFGERPLFLFPFIDAVRISSTTYSSFGMASFFGLVGLGGATLLAGGMGAVVFFAPDVIDVVPGLFDGSPESILGLGVTALFGGLALNSVMLTSAAIVSSFKDGRSIPGALCE